MSGSSSSSGVVDTKRTKDDSSSNNNPHRLTSLIPSNVQGGLQRKQRPSYRRPSPQRSDSPDRTSSDSSRRGVEPPTKQQRREHPRDDQSYYQSRPTQQQSSSSHRSTDPTSRSDQRRRPDDGDDDRDRSYYGPSTSSMNTRTATSATSSDMPPPRSSGGRATGTSSTRSSGRPMVDTTSYYGPSSSSPTPPMSSSLSSSDPRVATTSQGPAVPPPSSPNDDDDDESFDRQFYLQEDEGHYVQDTTDDATKHGRFLFTNTKIQARLSARQSALQDDQEAWEQNRLVSAGTMARSGTSSTIEQQQERVTLLVHQVKPPFLRDGRVSFSTVRDAVPTVKDASSDFAKCAREGSVTLRTLRAHKEKHAMRNKFWELGGTRMGNLVGVSNERKLTAEDTVATRTEDGEVDYKKTSGFASHMKKGNDAAVSEFAKTKSIREQREVRRSSRYCRVVQHSCLSHLPIHSYL